MELRPSSESRTPKRPLLQFLIEPALLEKVDDYRFANRFTSRAAAINFLLSKALESGDVTATPTT